MCTYIIQFYIKGSREKTPLLYIYSGVHKKAGRSDFTLFKIFKKVWILKENEMFVKFKQEQEI